MEKWKEASGFPTHEVSTHGRIRNKTTGHILKPALDRYGYQRLSIGNTDNVYIHRVVCETFNGKPDSKKNHVNHIDANRQNNNISNLEWCTPKENVRWSYDNGRIDPTIGLRKATEINKKRVRIIESNETFDSVKDCANRLGVKPTNVSRVLVGERKGQKLHGYHIEFVEQEVE